MQQYDHIVIGLGIAGLTKTYQLKKAGTKVLAFDANTQPGGNIASVKHKNVLLETGPNSLRMNDQWFAALAELKLTHRIQYADQHAQKRFVIRDGKPRALPQKPPQLLFSSFLSANTKWKAIKDLFSKTSVADKESLDTFFRTRLGNEVADYLLAPFVSGIYAGDPSKLLLSQSFPKLYHGINKHKSVIKAAKRGIQKQQHSGIFSFENGMQELVDRLYAYIQSDAQLNTKVNHIHTIEGGYVVNTDKGNYTTTALTIATPAHITADLLHDIGDFECLKEIHYPPVCIVHSIYEKDAFETIPQTSSVCRTNHARLSKTLDPTSR